MDDSDHNARMFEVQIEATKYFSALKYQNSRKF